MTPPAHATAAARPRHARRPAARPRPHGVPSRPRVAGVTAGGGAIAVPVRRGGLLRRTLRSLVTMPDHRFVGRLVGGPAWIWLLGLGLGGIVFMQVSLLKMNAGIGRAVESATTIERQNAALESEIGRLSRMERIQKVATDLGMSFAPAESTRFLRARPNYDPQRAARTMRPPKKPEPVQAPGALAGAPATTTAGTPVTTAAAPATTTAPAPATTAPAPALATTAPATTAPAAATTQPATAAPPVAAQAPPATVAQGAPAGAAAAP